MFGGGIKGSNGDLRYINVLLRTFCRTLIAGYFGGGISVRRCIVWLNFRGSCLRLVVAGDGQEMLQVAAALEGRTGMLASRGPRKQQLYIGTVMCL